MELTRSLIQQPEIKKVILKLLNICYGYCNLNIPLSTKYYLCNICVNENQQYDVVSSISTIVGRLKASFQFADAILFRNCVDSIGHISNGIDRIYYEVIGTIALSFVNGDGDCDCDFIFSHCGHQLEKQISFIHLVSREIGIIDYNDANGGNGEQITPQKGKAISQLKSILKPELILFLLAGYDNLQLIGYFRLLLGEERLDFNIELPFTVNHFIKSNEILEYLFTHYNGFFSGNKIWYFKNDQLLQNYVRLFKEANGENTLISVPGFAIQTLNRSSVDTITSIVNQGRSSFSFNSIFDLYKAVDLCYASVDRCIYLFKSIFLNYFYNDATTYTANNQPFYKIAAKKIDSYTFLKFLDWMYLNHYNYLNPNIVGKYSLSFQEENSYNGVAKSVFTKIGRYYGVPLFNGHFKIDEFNLNWEDLNLIDYILKDLKSQNEIHAWQKELLYEILECSAKHGRLKIFEFIFQHHNWVLMKPLFQAQKLFKLLFTSLTFNHFNLSLFFFEILPKISVKTFIKHSSDLSKIHFGN